MTDLWRCTVCGQVSTVGRCCGEETREPWRPIRRKDEEETRRIEAVADRAEQLEAEIERLRAERDALARENEAMKRCATKYLEWLGVTHMPLDQALRDDMLNPRMCGDAALAQQHGGSTDG